ncbi:MAG: hypothetical protein ACYCOX_02900 [Acidobacteriaceae bacterium]
MDAWIAGLLNDESADDLIGGDTCDSPLKYLVEWKKDISSLGGMALLSQ